VKLYEVFTCHRGEKSPHLDSTWKNISTCHLTLSM